MTRSQYLAVGAGMGACDASGGVVSVCPAAQQQREALAPCTDSRPSVRGCGPASSWGKQSVVPGAMRLQRVICVAQVATP